MRSQNEDLLQTLLCLAISTTSRQKPAIDTNKTSTPTIFYCVEHIPTLHASKKLRAKTAEKFSKRAYFAPYKDIPSDVWGDCVLRSSYCRVLVHNHDPYLTAFYGHAPTRGSA